MPLTWERCPFCKESTDIERLGKPITVSVKKDGKLHVEICALKRCNFCGKTWRSELPTMKEAMGYDGEEETPF